MRNQNILEFKNVGGDRIHPSPGKVDPQSALHPPRIFIPCPKLKSNGNRSTEICFNICKYYHRCHVVHNIYLKEGYEIKKKSKKGVRG